MGISLFCKTTTDQGDKKVGGTLKTIVTTFTRQAPKIPTNLKPVNNYDIHLVPKGPHESRPLATNAWPPTHVCVGKMEQKHYIVITIG